MYPVCDYPAKNPDPNPIECLCSNVKRKIKGTGPNNTNEQKITVEQKNIFNPMIKLLISAESKY